MLNNSKLITSPLKTRSNLIKIIASLCLSPTNENIFRTIHELQKLQKDIMAQNKALEDELKVRFYNLTSLYDELRTEINNL